MMFAFNQKAMLKTSFVNSEESPIVCLERAMDYNSLIPFFIKLSVVLLFTGLLIYWSSQAIEKYNEEPTATYTSFTQGDDDEFIGFPQLTFCDSRTYIPRVAKKCRNESSKTYIQVLLDCLKHEEFDLEKFKSQLNFSLDELIDDKYDPENFENVQGIPHGLPLSKADLKSTLYIKFDLIDGMCIGFDPSHLKLPIEDFNSLTLPFKFKALYKDKVFHVDSNFGEDLFWTDGEMRVQFHTTDFDPPKLRIDPGIDKIKNNEFYTLKKKMQDREPTKKSPCQAYNRNTCEEIKAYETIGKKFKCKVPFLYTGKHLDYFVPGYVDLPACNDTQVMIEIIESIKNNTSYEKECMHVYPCKRVYFEATKLELKPKPQFMGFGYNDLEVEHYITYISYDLQSLISELGGIIGMFLGLSGISIGFDFANWLGLVLSKNKVESGKVQVS